MQVTDIPEYIFCCKNVDQYCCCSTRSKFFLLLSLYGQEPPWFWWSLTDKMNWTYNLFHKLRRMLFKIQVECLNISANTHRNLERHGSVCFCLSLAVVRLLNMKGNLGRRGRGQGSPTQDKYVFGRRLGPGVEWPHNKASKMWPSRWAWIRVRYLYQIL